jgi:hypothetical protein
VLCVYRASDTHVLAGLTTSREVRPLARVDPMGPCEGLDFLDAAGLLCWRLFLLPDSDYWAWDTLLSAWETEC